jgi:hypothetical protein
MTKDIIWAFANAVSQVCVEDDSVSSGADNYYELLIFSHANVSERSWNCSNRRETWWPLCEAGELAIRFLVSCFDNDIQA